MFVTDEVSQPDTSSKARDEHPSNIQCISLTNEVSQPERSREVRDEQ
jgi:hypothetical protein